MTTSCKALAGALILSIVLAPPLALAKTPVATGTGGAVATISEQASHSALNILNKGGNAVDAAVAAAATLGVTDPFSCGIGGGGFMVIYLAKDKRVITIDHREMAPAAFTPAVFLDNGKEIDFEKAVASGAAVGVPGTVRGWHEALERYGTMQFKQVLAPAIDVASKGFTVNETFSHLTRENERKFQQFSTTSALYLRNGKAVTPGTRLRNPDMAKAYREIAARGYEGGMSQLRAFMRTLRPAPPADPVMRFETAMGEQLQVDTHDAGFRHRFARLAAQREAVLREGLALARRRAGANV